MTFFNQLPLYNDGSFCLREGSYNAGVKDDPRLYLISFVNFEAHLRVCIENVLYK